MKFCDEQFLSITKDHDSFLSFASQFQAYAQVSGVFVAQQAVEFI
jgi:hypothetical protein